tara:strand:- start:4036 stop:4668 length:633 start_codon:yes stop_codon:yes gene_type:complete
MRYQKNQKIWTIGFQLINKETGKVETWPSFVKPIPNLYEINEIYFRKLIITDHEKVSGEFSTEKEYDGFKAKDSDGNVWHNQYPEASYSQTSNEQDFVFDFSGLDEYYEEANQENLDFDDVMNNILSKHPVIHTASLLYFMNDLDGGLLDENNQLRIEREHPDVYEQLKVISNQIIQQFKEQTGLELKTKTKVLNGKKEFQFKIKEWYIE